MLALKAIFASVDWKRGYCEYFKYLFNIECFIRFGIEALTIAGTHKHGTYGSSFISMGR